LESDKLSWKVDRTAECGSLSGLSSLNSGQTIREFVPEVVVLIWKIEPDAAVPYPDKAEHFKRGGTVQLADLVGNLSAHDMPRAKNLDLVNLSKYVATGGNPRYRPKSLVAIADLAGGLEPLVVEIQVDFTNSRRQERVIGVPVQINGPVQESAIEKSRPTSLHQPSPNDPIIRSDEDNIHVDMFRGAGLVCCMELPNLHTRLQRVRGYIASERKSIMSLLKRVHMGEFASERDHPWGTAFPKLSEVDSVVLELAGVDFEFFGQHEVIEAAINILRGPTPKSAQSTLASAAAHLTVTLDMFGDARKGYGKALRNAGVQFREVIRKVKK
jgi:hypothetical protein